RAFQSAHGGDVLRGVLAHVRISSADEAEDARGGAGRDRASHLIERRIPGLRNGGAVFDNLAVVPKHSKKQKDADAAVRVELVRAVPPIDECIKAAEANATLAGFGRSYIKLMVQRAQAELRAAILAGRGAKARDRAAMIDALVQAVVRAVAKDEPVLRPVVNATGVVL